MEKLEFTVMKYPWMREELLDYLERLGDLAYQKSCWVNGICPAGVKHDELDYAIHFLFDDTELSGDPEACIGVFLKDKEEARCVKKVCGAIDALFVKHGTELSDAEYIGLPEWQDVVHAAQDALRVFKGNA